jgi:hypothetical protein
MRILNNYIVEGRKEGKGREGKEERLKNDDDGRSTSRSVEQ